MNVTKPLLGEHGVLNAMFDHLEQAIPRDQSLEAVRAQAALLAAALVSHTTVEEEGLYPALEERIGRDGPLAMLRMDHDRLEDAFSWLPQLTDIEETKRLLLDTIRLARQHFAREEQVLFPLAYQHLTSEVLHRLGDEWADRRLVGTIAVEA